MGPVDGLWHVLNLFAPAIGVGALAASLTKLLWRADLRAVSWRRLAAWACTCAAAVQVGGLVVFGRDGKMATYAVMVMACALGLWWRGFVARL
jgi:hypothetical protein